MDTFKKVFFVKNKRFLLSTGNRMVMVYQRVKKRTCEKSFETLLFKEKKLMDGMDFHGYFVIAL